MRLGSVLYFTILTLVYVHFNSHYYALNLTAYQKQYGVIRACYLLLGFVWIKILPGFQPEKFGNTIIVFMTMRVGSHSHKIQKKTKFNP